MLIYTNLQTNFFLFYYFLQILSMKYSIQLLSQYIIDIFFCFCVYFCYFFFISFPPLLFPSPHHHITVYHPILSSSPLYSLHSPLLPLILQSLSSHHHHLLLLHLLHLHLLPIPHHMSTHLPRVWGVGTGRGGLSGTATTQQLHTHSVDRVGLSALLLSSLSCSLHSLILSILLLSPFSCSLHSLVLSTHQAHSQTSATDHHPLTFVHSL